MKLYLYILIFLILIGFEGLIEIPMGNTVRIAIFLLSLLSFRKNRPLNGPLIWLGLCLIANFISCKIYRGQSYFDTFRGSLDILAIYTVWLFCRFNFSPQYWEKILKYTCLGFGICFLIQYLAMPNIIFSGQIRVDSDEQRVALTGQGLASFSVLFALNKIIYNHDRKFVPILLLGIIAMFGCGYRTMLFAIVISVSVMLIKLGFSRKYFIPVIVVIALLYLSINYLPFVNNQIANMVERQNILEQGGFKNDIRYENLMYHYLFYFKNIQEMIFGSGMPFQDTEYGKFINDYMIDALHYWNSDWGLIGLSWLVGIPTVLVMIYYSIKIFITKLPKEYLYVNMYFFQILISSVTSHEFYIEGNFIIQAVVIAFYISILKNQKLKESYARKNK